MFTTAYTTAPIVVLGGQTNNNSSLRSAYSLKNITQNTFEYKIVPWVYLSNPTITNKEYVPMTSAVSGKGTWGNLPYEADKVQNVTGTWKTVTFTQTFAIPPVIIVTPATAMT